MMKISSRELVGRAEREIETIPVDRATTLIHDDNILFVDLREGGELRREGKIPGAINAPRGLIEFWVDPESPYFNPAFEGDRKLVLFCAMGWRSALATKALKDMGLENIAHIGGGFTAWREAGGPIEGGAQATAVK